MSYFVFFIVNSCLYLKKIAKIEINHIFFYLKICKLYSKSKRQKETKKVVSFYFKKRSLRIFYIYIIQPPDKPF